MMADEHFAATESGLAITSAGAPTQTAHSHDRSAEATSVSSAARSSSVPPLCHQRRNADGEEHDRPAPGAPAQPSYAQDVLYPAAYLTVRCSCRRTCRRFGGLTSWAAASHLTEHNPVGRWRTVVALRQSVTSRQWWGSPSRSSSRRATDGS